MPSLESLRKIAGSDAQDDEGFFSEFGKTQDKVLRNFNTGLARFFGLPRTAVDLLEAGENKLLDFVGIDPEKAKLSTFTGMKDVVGGFLPSALGIQDLGAKAGLAFKAGEEPQDLASRIIQNIGTTAPLLPLLGPAALIPELTAATTGAVGGKILEATEFGQVHPELARAIGELGGGLSPVGVSVLKNFFFKGGTVGAVAGLGKKGLQKGKGILPKTKERVETRLRAIEPSPEIRRAEIAREALSPEGEVLTVGQRAGGGVARLSRTVERDVPEVAEQMAKQRIDALRNLERQFKKTGDVGDARAFIEAELTQAANKANIALSKVRTVKDPSALSTSTENILSSAVKKARIVETQAWNKLPSGEASRGSSLVGVHRSSLENITEGGSLAEISSFAREKLGTLKPVIKEGKKTGEFALKGGKLFNKKKTTASAKAIHQFYSQLGRERAALARQGGTANKIRIIDDLRAAALDDLDAAGLSAPYTDAIKLSRELNEKFTKGAVGRMLGFGRGETRSPTKALDDLIGRGGQSGKESIQQALRGAPETKANIEDFIKVQFAIAAEKNNVINANAGNKFLKDFDEILSDVFPSLKTELQDAIAKQIGVDELIGVPQSSQLSPLVKEKTAASIFLKANPNEEMASIINSTSIQRADVLTDLVKLSKRDTTGKAFAGLQNGFAEEVFEFARKGDIIDGKRILEKINKLRPALLKSGLFEQKDIARFNRIGDAFGKIASELKQQVLPDGIINDLPSKLLSNSLRILAVRSLGSAKKVFGLGSSFGTSLQEANIASAAAVRFAKGLTNDEARNLLVRSVKDPKLMDELLRDISKISTTQRQGIFARIGRKVQELRSTTPSQALSKVGELGKRAIERADLQPPRAGAVVPPVASLGEILGADERREPLIQELSRLKALIP